MEKEIEIRRVRATDLESLWDTINSVCNEKWYVATVAGFTLEQSRAFLERTIKNTWPQVVAVNTSHIVGWCDIIPNTKTGFTHVGHLGMGVHRNFRRRGIGRRLVKDCLSLAGALGLERVELEVFSDNQAAIRLYKSLGFAVEGLKRQARKLEGRYQDIQLMASSLTT